MQTARLRQTTLDRIRAEGAGPLRVHWSDTFDIPYVQYSEPRSGAALAVCTVDVMPDTALRREYYPARFRGLARHYGMRLPDRLSRIPKAGARRLALYYLARPHLANGTARAIWLLGGFPG